MAKGVEFTAIRNFEREMNRMPNFALHELAHAYHDRVLPQGFANPEMLADAKSGAIRTVLTESDAAWLENENPVRWVDGGSRFLWLSERDGWRHAYSAGTDGQQLARITGGDFDVIQVEAVDEKNGWLYFSTSPENPTQHYLYRARLGGGTLERLSPAAQPGWHTYDFSPDAQWATTTAITRARNG